MNILAQWVKQEQLEDLSNLKSIFTNNKPFPHLVIKDFLQEDVADRLIKALQKQKFSHKESDLFSLNQTEDLQNTRDEQLKSFSFFLASKEFAQFMKELTGISVKPGALDLSGSLYKSGDYLLCHDDQVEDRKIAYILYLSKNFAEKDGGRFVLFDNLKGKPGKESARYVPEWNSLMIFEVSKISFHAVEENCSKKDRYAIGGWLH